MALTVEVKCAANLPMLKAHAKATLIGRSWDNPFCELTFQGQKQSTKPKVNDPNPEWMEVLKWTLEVVPDTTEVVEVVVFDFEETTNHREMSTGKIPLTTVLAEGSDDLIITLEHVQGRPREDDEGKAIDATLHVGLTYRPPVSEILKEQVSSLETELEQTKAGNSEASEILREKVSSLETELEQSQARNAEVSAELARLKDQMREAIGEVCKIRLYMHVHHTYTAGKESNYN